MQELICKIFGHKIVRLERIGTIEFLWKRKSQYEFYCQRCGKRIRYCH